MTNKLKGILFAIGAAILAILTTVITFLINKPIEVKPAYPVKEIKQGIQDVHDAKVDNVELKAEVVKEEIKSKTTEDIKEDN